MKEKDSSDEESSVIKNSQKNYLLEAENIDNEDEKINNEEEKLNNEKKVNPMNSFLNLVNRVKKNKNNEKDNNIIDTNEEKKK